MAQGVIEYNEEGNPKCEICGLFFKRVLTHVRQKHFMNERQYKSKFGFDLIKGICSKASSDKSRAKVIEHYDTVVAGNLLYSGELSRFSKGTKGRTRDKVSTQSKLRLTKQIKSSKKPVVIESNVTQLSLLKK